MSDGHCMNCGAWIAADYCLCEACILAERQEEERKHADDSPKVKARRAREAEAKRRWDHGGYDPLSELVL